MRKGSSCVIKQEFSVMGRKKGKQSAGCGSKALRAAVERQRWSNARDDLARDAARPVGGPSRAAPSVKDLLRLIPRAPPRPPAAAPPARASAAEPVAPAATLALAAARAVGESLHRYDASAAGAFALLPAHLVEEISAAAARGRRVGDDNVALLANPRLERLAVAGDVGDDALERLLPRRRAPASADGDGDAWAVPRFRGCVSLLELSLCSPRVTADFVARLCFAVPTLSVLRLGATCLAAPGQGCLAIADALRLLTGLEVLDVAACDWADEAALRRALAGRASSAPGGFGDDDRGRDAVRITADLEVRCREDRVSAAAARRLAADHARVAVVRLPAPS